MKSPNRTERRVPKRGIMIDGRKTSTSLEDQFWQALREIAKERGSTLQDLVTSIKAERRKGGLSSAIRVFVLEHYQDQISAQKRAESTKEESPGRTSGPEL
jgi:predicted DNA-binding ribbon-helix-helix protein